MDPSKLHTQEEWEAAYRETMADIANRKIEKLIESWPVVYMDKHNNLTWVDEIGTTRKARLAFIEELPKEPCDHDGVFDAPEYNYYCRKCGVEVVQEWKAKV